MALFCGTGRGRVEAGLTVACIRAREEIVGAWRVDDPVKPGAIERLGFLVISTGGKGAGRAAYMACAWLCFFVEVDVEEDIEANLGRPRVFVEVEAEE